jgi:hypothetical protein
VEPWQDTTALPSPEEESDVPDYPTWLDQHPQYRHWLQHPTERVRYRARAAGRVEPPEMAEDHEATLEAREDTEQEW